MGCGQRLGEFPYPSVSGAISDKFVRKVALRDFSRSMLGEYMGKAPSPASYSMGTLSAREGYVVLQVTDYTEPDGGNGQRGHMSHVYAGIPIRWYQLYALSLSLFRG